MAFDSCSYLNSLPKYRNTIILNFGIHTYGLYTGELTKRVLELSSQLLVTLYTLSIYPSAHKQLRRHPSNPFCEFPCIRSFFLPILIIHNFFFQVTLPCQVENKEGFLQWTRDGFGLGETRSKYLVDFKLKKYVYLL